MVLYTRYASPIHVAVCEDYILGFEFKQMEVISGLAGYSNVQAFSEVQNPTCVAHDHKKAVAASSAGVHLFSMTTLEQQIEQFLQQGMIEQV